MRHKVTVNGVRMWRSHYVWNFHNPHDHVMPGEVIHHKDENEENDAPENLQKMLDADHRSLHSGGSLRRYHKENPEKARAVSRKNVIKMKDFLAKHPEKEAERKRKCGEHITKLNKSRALPREERLRRRAAYMRSYRKRRGGVAI